MNECINWEPDIFNTIWSNYEVIGEKFENNLWVLSVKFEEPIYLWEFQKKIKMWDDKLFLFLQDGKHYIYNSEWKLVFLKWRNKVRPDSNINLCVIDGENLISVEYDWKEYEYYLENWEKYVPKKLSHKIIPWIKKAIDDILEFIWDMWKAIVK